MSVEAYNPRQDYVGNGAQTVFTFDFKITSKDELMVQQSTDLDVRTWKVLGNDVVRLSSVTFDSLNGGGTVTLVAAVPNTHKLALILAPDAPLQTSKYRNKGDFTLRSIESSLDHVMKAVHRLQYLIRRSPKVDDVMTNTQAAAFNFDIPSPVGQAGKILAVKADGTGLEWKIDV